MYHDYRQMANKRRTETKFKIIATEQTFFQIIFNSMTLRVMKSLNEVKLKCYFFFSFMTFIIQL